MNLPFRFANSKFQSNGNNELNDYSILSQSIAKKYHKIVNKRKITETTFLHDSYENFYHSDRFKDEILSWLFHLPMKERIKACTIENKWLATMILSMATEYFKNNDVMFKIKEEFLNEEESYMQNILGAQQNGNFYPQQNNFGFQENSFENFFHIKSNFNSYSNSQKYKTNEYIGFSNSKIDNNLFLNEVVFFTIKDKNDSFSISTDLLVSREIFEHNFKIISKNKYFNTAISVNYENSYKIYNWNFPDWFKPKEFNSLPEFIVAYIEQLLCVRFWYYREKQENSFKQINDFISITEDKKFNELYDIKNRLIDFVKQNYPKKNLFREGIKADKIAESVYIDPKIQKLVNSTCSNQMIKFSSKYPMIKSNYSDVVKNLYDAYEKGEEHLINKILFISLKLMGNYEEFVFNRIVEELQNLFSEKNAKDLINEIDTEEKEKLNKKKNKKKKENLNQVKEKEKESGSQKNNKNKTSYSLFSGYEFSNSQNNNSQIITDIRKNSHSFDKENSEYTSNKFLNSINSTNFNDSVLIVENGENIEENLDHLEYIEKVNSDEKNNKNFRNKNYFSKYSIDKNEFFKSKKDNVFSKTTKISEISREKSKNLRSFEIKFDLGNQINNNQNQNQLNSPIKNSNNDSNFNDENKNKLDSIVNNIMSSVLESFNTEENSNIPSNCKYEETSNNTKSKGKKCNNNISIKDEEKDKNSDRKSSSNTNANIDLLDVPINKIELIIAKKCVMKKFISRLRVISHKNSDINMKRSKSNKNFKNKNPEFTSISSMLLNLDSTRNNFSILNTQNIEIKNISTKMSIDKDKDSSQENIVQSTEAIEISSKPNNTSLDKEREDNSKSNTNTFDIESNKIQNNIEISYDGNNNLEQSTIANNIENDVTIKGKKKVKGAIYLYPTDNNKNKKKNKKNTSKVNELEQLQPYSEDQKINNNINNNNNSNEDYSYYDNTYSSNKNSKLINNENKFDDTSESIMNMNTNTNVSNADILDKNQNYHSGSKDNNNAINYEDKSFKKDAKNNRFNNNKQYNNQNSNKKNNSIYVYSEIGNVINENSFFKNNTNNETTNTTNATNISNINNNQNQIQKTKSSTYSNASSNTNNSYNNNYNNKFNTHKSQNNKKQDNIKIETLNHEIINNKCKNKKMVETGCQTELKKLEIVKGENFQQNKKKKNVDTKICKEINNSIIVGNSNNNNKISKINSFTCKSSKEKKLDSPKTLLNPKFENEHNLNFNHKSKLNKKGENNSSENLSFKKSYMEESAETSISISSSDQKTYKDIKDYKEKRINEDIVLKNEDCNSSHIIEENESNSQYSSSDNNKYRNTKNIKKGYGNYNKNYNSYFNNTETYKRKKEFKQNSQFVNYSMNPRMDGYGNFIYGKGKPFNQIHYSFYNYNNYQINNNQQQGFNNCGKSFNSFNPNQVMQMNSFYNTQYNDKIDMDMRKSFSNNEFNNNEYNKDSQNGYNTNFNEFDFNMKMPLYTNTGMYSLQKIEINDQSTFYQKLHNDIIDYSTKVTDILKNLRQTRIIVIDFIKLALENIKIDFSKDLYGSFATNLNIETSDIDIQIKIPNENIDVESLISLICSYFASIKIIETISPITTAAIPVIKLSIDPSLLTNINGKFNELKEFCDKNIETIEKYKEFLNSDNFKDYIYDINEIRSVKIDLSFVTPSFYNENVVKYVTNQTIMNPELVPLNQVIKKFLNLKKLNSCFNGGLASYSLFLILLGFLRYPKSNNQIVNNNLGICLMGFFEFYGKQFDFSKYIIDICNLPNPFFSSDYLDAPYIIDPLTRKNVAKNSFRIDDVKDAFGEANDFFQSMKLKFDKSPKELYSKNMIYELHSKYLLK